MGTLSSSCTAGATCFDSASLVQAAMTDSNVYLSPPKVWMYRRYTPSTLTAPVWIRYKPGIGKGNYTQWVSKATLRPGPLPDPFRMFFETAFSSVSHMRLHDMPYRRRSRTTDNMITDLIPTPALPIRQFQVEKLSNLSQQQSSFPTIVSRAQEGRCVVNSNFAMVSPFRLLS
jgi:hypothetical protein